MSTTAYPSRGHITLGYLGLIPFIYLTLVFYFVPGQSLLNGFLVYSLAILAFICGSMWRPGEQPPLQSLLLIAPYALIPLAWLIDKHYCLLLLSIIYPTLYLLQTRQSHWSVLPAVYKKMRLHLTLAVGLLHLVLFWLYQSKGLE